MVSLGTLFLSLASLRDGGLITSYTYPINDEKENPITTLTITDEWGTVLGVPEDEDTLDFSVAMNEVPLVVLQALRSKWELILRPEDVKWKELVAVRDYFIEYRLQTGR